MNPISANSPVAPNWLAARANTTPQAIALVDGKKSLTFEGLYNHVRHSAGQLLTNGIRAGDHVALFLPNEPQTIAWIFALWHIGAVVVPLNRRLVAGEIAFQLQNAQCKYLLHDEALPSNIAAPNVKFLTSDAVAYDASQPDIPPAPQPDHALGVIMYTSGTTGQPKGVILSFGNLLNSARASADKIGAMPDDRWLCILPLYHVGGLSILVRSVLYGTTVALYPAFDAEKINHALTHDPITLISLVPTMLYRLLQIKTEAWNPALRLVLLGGAAAPPALIEQALAQKIPVALTYGLTEAASQVATALPSEVAQKVGSVGKPLSGTQVRIVDELGQDLPPNTYGEIVVKSPTVMQGYWGREPIINQELHTGDIGYLDEDGDLWLVQRRTDLIVSGGENIYPSEVENVLLRHPAVETACVVGIPHPEWGQQVVAAVVIMGDITPEDLLAHCREHLAGYKVPRRLLFVPELPQTASGKIHRQQVQKLFEG